MKAKRKCLSEETILGFVREDLLTEERRMVERHLAGCDLCQAAVEGTRHYLLRYPEVDLRTAFSELDARFTGRGGATTSDTVPASGHGFTQRLWIMAGIAASILVLVGIGITTRYLIHQRNHHIALLEMRRDSIRQNPNQISAQYLPPPEENVHNEVEELPVFPGGEEALHKFLTETISCPPQPGEASNPSSLFVHFIVEEDGSVTNVTLVREMGEGCTDEAIRGIEAMPKWVPGKNGGEAVRVGYILLLKFS